MFTRFKVAFNGKEFFLQQDKTMKASTKQMLYRKMKEKYQIKKIISRRSRIVCIE